MFINQKSTSEAIGLTISVYALKISYSCLVPFYDVTKISNEAHMTTETVMSNDPICGNTIIFHSSTCSDLFANSINVFYDDLLCSSCNDCLIYCFRC